MSNNTELYLCLGGPLAGHEVAREDGSTVFDVAVLPKTVGAIVPPDYSKPPVVERHTYRLTVISGDLYWVHQK